jgi:hypothetical protein
MANGELKVRDDKSKELRDDTLRALWAVNNALVNPAYEKDTPQNIIDDRKAFLAKYPNAGALIKYADSGQPVDFIYIPVNSNSLSARYASACQIERVNKIDLSAIAVGFNITPRKDLVSSDVYFSYKYPDTPYCDFEGIAGQLLVQSVTLPNRQKILSWTFGDIYDAEADPDNYFPNSLSLYQEQPPEQKLIAASQIVTNALLMTNKLRPSDGVINKALTPPILINYATVLDSRAKNFFTAIDKNYFELP